MSLQQPQSVYFLRRLLGMGHLQLQLLLHQLLAPPTPPVPRASLSASSQGLKSSQVALNIPVGLLPRRVLCQQVFPHPAHMLRLLA